ncbi:MAG: methyltransferase domain-containing protein [Candidatus Abyssubacteria bacterium]|nr:methyltransferase domain-containing protein [Candidatus Abyssubacteria bacterium]
MNSTGGDFRARDIDLSEEAVVGARASTEEAPGDIKVSKEDFLSLEEKFGIVFAFEVLEHYEDDEAVLGKMHDLLDQDGYLIISVPARAKHAKHWGPNDEWAGHVRRYERDELKSMAEAKGLETIGIYSFGVPIADMTKSIYDRLIRRELRKETKLDGVQKCERRWTVPVVRLFHPVLSLLFNRLTLYPFLLLQCLFLKTDLGTAYLVVFQKA